MQRAIVLIALLLLAGCAEPPAPAPIAAPPTLVPVVEQHPFQAEAYVTAHGGCTGGVCSGGSYPTVIYESPEAAWIQAVAFDIAKLPYEDRPVEWKLTCTAPDDEDPGCLRPLGHGQQPLPVHVAVAGLNLTPETELWLEVVVPPIATPVVDTFATILMGNAQVSGTVDLLTYGNVTGGNATAWLPEQKRETVPVSFDGHSGPCNMVEPNCMHWPGGSNFPLQLDGPIVAVNLTMTWTSMSAADATLGLEVGQFPCGGTCFDVPAATGPSPLRLQVDGLSFETSVLAMVFHANPTGVQTPADNVFSYMGTRTPVHIEGTVTFEPEDEDDDGDGGSDDP